MIWKIIGNGKSFFDKCKRDKINAYSAQSALFYYIIDNSIFDGVFFPSSIHTDHGGDFVKNVSDCIARLHFSFFDFNHG